MKVYLVGGAVRDQLLDYPFYEKDWVVVGASPQHMIDLGYEQVGKDFPVFLHPVTKEEYALARIERKTAAGYHGFDLNFSSDVTLEQDLSRRDFTINAIAQDTDGTIIDPYAGQQDIENRVLRHISNAFSEDPVRILRGARFLARYAHLGFKVHPDTLALMRTMVNNGEVDALVKERVWREFERMMGERSPLAGIELLNQVNALPKLFNALALSFEESKSKFQSRFDRYRSHDAVGRIALLYTDVDQQDLVTAKAPKRFQSTSQTLRQLIVAIENDDATNLAVASTTQGLLKNESQQQLLQSLLSCAKPASALANNWLDLIQQLKAIIPKPFIEQGLTGAEIGKAIKDAQLSTTQKWLLTTIN